MKKTMIAGLGTAALLALSACEDGILGEIESMGSQDYGASDTDVRVIETTAERVVDGDTVTVALAEDLEATNEAGTEHSVRVLGLDAPEMNFTSSEDPECGAEEATDELTDLLFEGDQGRDVTLVFDEHADEIDRFGRSLAYIEVDGVDAGAHVIEAGYAAAWYPSSEPEPERYNEYAQLQQEAKGSGAGAWGQCESMGR